MIRGDITRDGRLAGGVEYGEDGFGMDHVMLSYVYFNARRREALVSPFRLAYFGLDPDGGEVFDQRGRSEGGCEGC